MCINVNFFDLGVNVAYCLLLLGPLCWRRVWIQKPGDQVVDGRINFCKYDNYPHGLFVIFVYFEFCCDLYWLCCTLFYYSVVSFIQLFFKLFLNLSLVFLCDFFVCLYFCCSSCVVCSVLLPPAPREKWVKRNKKQVLCLVPQWTMQGKHTGNVAFLFC